MRTVTDVDNVLSLRLHNWSVELRVVSLDFAKDDRGRISQMEYRKTKTGIKRSVVSLIFKDNVEEKYKILHLVGRGVFSLLKTYNDK